MMERRELLGTKACLVIMMVVMSFFGFGQSMSPYSGTDFMFCIPDLYSWADSKLIISSGYKTQFVVSCDGIGYSQTFSINKDSVVEIDLPATATPKGWESTTDTTIKISSLKPISVMLRRKYAMVWTGLMNVLPTQACGTSYRVCGYGDLSNPIGYDTQPNVVAITALCDSTPIKISANDTSHTGNISPIFPTYLMLNKGESYVFRTPSLSDRIPFKSGDFTGTLIETLDTLNKKIAVTVNDGDYIGVWDKGGGNCCLDYMYEMLAPDKLADTLFFDFRSNFTEACRYRVVPTKDSTRIWVNNQFHVMKNTFDYYQFDDSNNVKIQSDKPVHIYRFLFSDGAKVEVGGDPEMTRVEPARNGITKSIVLPRERKTNTHKYYLQVMCRLGNEKDLTINGNLKAQYFKKFLADPNWVYAEFEIDTNIQIIESSRPFKGYHGVSIITGSLVHNLTGISNFDNISLPEPVQLRSCTYPLEIVSPILSDSVVWWNGSSASTQKVDSAGKYWVRQKLYEDCGDAFYHTDTIIVVHDLISYQTSIGKEVCVDDSLKVQIGGDFNRISWSDFLTTKNRFIKPNQWYYYELQKHSCRNNDSLRSSSLPHPDSKVTAPFTSCDTSIGVINLSDYGIVASDSTRWEPTSKFRYTGKNQYKVAAKSTFRSFLNITNYYGCTSTDTVEFIFKKIDDTLKVNGDFDCQSGLLTLEVENPEMVGEITWEVANQTQQGNSIDISNFNSSEVTGVLNYKYDFGCEGFQPFSFKTEAYLRDEGLSNVFTPNGDGINDVYHPITNENSRPCYQFEVFNRWGKSVFNSINNSDGWDGKIIGKDASGGVYFYILDLQGESHSGHFTLIR